MTWQDWVFSLGQLVLLIALLPSIFSKDKPAIATSLIYGTVAAVFIFTYASLGLWTSSMAAILITSGWLTLVVQKAMVNRKKHDY